MNLQQKMPTTVDEFLRWNEGREGKREFVRGRVVEMMINVTRNHMRLATRLLVTLASKLDTSRFDVGSTDFGVRTADGIRYPDVFVDLVGPQSRGSDLSTSAPIFLAEILSSSSYSHAFGEKVTDYTRLPSLLHYMVLSQDEPSVWLWSRTDDGWYGPAQMAGMDAAVDLHGLALSLNIGDLYRGIIEQNLS
jgi:Uma2 family endonuclease